MVSRIRGFLGEVEDLLENGVDPDLAAISIERRRGSRFRGDVALVRDAESRLSRLRKLYPGLPAEEGPLLERARRVLIDPQEGR